MIGLAEVLVVAVLLGVIFLSRRRGGAGVVREQHVGVDTGITIKLSRHMITVVGSVAVAVAVAVTALWMALPPILSTIVAGIVAGLVAAGLATRIARGP
jgi:hypothetical protein